MDDIAQVLHEMRTRVVNNRSTSPTLIAWADRIEAALKRRPQQKLCEQSHDGEHTIIAEGRHQGECECCGERIMSPAEAAKEFGTRP